MKPRAKWTFMVYLAGDNDLEEFGVQDLEEMKKIGSNDELSIVAEFDQMSDQFTRRYYLTGDQTLDADCVGQLPGVNTGDPQALVDFTIWACETYPAERYALVLWNHGSGWKDDDIYQIAQKRGVADRLTRGQVRGLGSGRGSRALFKTSLERLIVGAVHTQRAILFGDTSRDFLDSTELRSALAQVTQSIGRPLDLIGFDACLMSMLEVDYQVRGVCRVAVGSQEDEPGNGWPYDAILAHLAGEPGLTPAALSKTIVGEYISYYKSNYPDLTVTQAAVDLTRIEPVAEQVSSLAHTLTSALADREKLGILFGALRSAQTFSDRDYVDLVHFCQLLVDADATSEMGIAAQKVVATLTSDSQSLLAQGHNGSEVTNAHGMSIYLPTRILSPLYNQLEFAHCCDWDDFLDAFIHPA